MCRIVITRQLQDIGRVAGKASRKSTAPAACDLAELVHPADLPRGGCDGRDVAHAADAPAGLADTGLPDAAAGGGTLGRSAATADLGQDARGRAGALGLVVGFCLCGGHADVFDVVGRVVVDDLVADSPFAAIGRNGGRGLARAHAQVPFLVRLDSVRAADRGGFCLDLLVCAALFLHSWHRGCAATVRVVAVSGVSLRLAWLAWCGRWEIVFLHTDGVITSTVLFNLPKRCPDRAPVGGR